MHHLTYKGGYKFVTTLLLVHEFLAELVNFLALL